MERSVSQLYSVIKLHSQRSNRAFIHVSRLFDVCARHKSTKSKRYSKTLNLPKTNFPLTIRDGVAAKREIEIQRVCGFDKLYAWQSSQDRRSQFVLHDGPPYANGKPHVGHALNKILKDITNRYKLLRGFKVHYIPGWDCHGLPIELKALEGGKTDQKTMTPVDIRKKARRFAEQAIKHQKESFRRWGVMADWNNNCYTTFSPQYQADQIQIFYSLFEKGYIYQDYMPVYWSPSSRTALAEAELEYNEEHVSKSVYVKFPMAQVSNDIKNIAGNSSVYAVVWTTTPWTLPFNQAICYGEGIQYCLWKSGKHNEILLCEESFSEKLASLIDSKLQLSGVVDGRKLDGATYVHPMNNRELPFLAGHHVVKGKGTGLVHTAPAHGHDDFQLAVRHGIPITCHVDPEGRYMDDVGQGLAGKYVGDEANSAVLKYLESYILHVEDIVHSYPYDWRTKKPVIIRASQQWFIDTSKLRDKAIEMLSDVNILPKSSEKGMLSQLEKRTYWCISRQRVWGLPIPVFYHKETGDTLINKKTIDHLYDLIRKHGADCWWTLPMLELLPTSLLEKEGLGESDDYVKENDILDIWFDSGVSWATVLKDVGQQADVYYEGLDQFGCWFQTSLLTSTALRQTPPFRNLLAHGFTTDEHGKKMSKSLGNVVDPAIVVNGGKNKESDPAYGADVLRWWAANAQYHTNIMIGPNILNGFNEKMYKVRKSLRFLLGNLYEFEPAPQTIPYEDLLPQDKYMLHLVHEFGTQVTKWYDEFSYSKVILSLEKFVNTHVSSYFYTIKDRCYCSSILDPSRLSCLTVQYHLLDVLVKTMAPILPHFAEEVYRHYPKNKQISGETSIFKTQWFDTKEEWCNNDLMQNLKPVFDIRNDLHGVLGSEDPVEYDIAIFASRILHDILREFQKEVTSSTSALNEILQTSQASVLDKPPPVIPDDSQIVDGVCNVYSEKSSGTVLMPEEYKLIIMPAEGNICERCRRYTAKSASSPCERCIDVLAGHWE
ncbi:isoleucine--tRNA ligase, mitochondrial-like [Gigantopelta aegis]|uniref:isoleucine--tRNA ligase, mitochondrial-like n=1 Tax=Gigantopelta aegis TaxID=1735272 RepID=UPI001B88D5BE|nr:isoleucine--tRNA ligase, mitochondrial-like [Gigantopelta aegis]